jgi:hypothetical protein
MSPEAATAAELKKIGLGAQVIFAMFPVIQAGGGRRPSEKDAAFRTAAHSSTEGVQLAR